jgi:2,3,4,5-tetrahydropyridine-2-carboxylate N-succinyltransferase
MNSLQTIIYRTSLGKALLQGRNYTKAIREVIELLDSGKLRVAEPKVHGK